MPDEESLRQLARSPASFSVWLGILVLFVLFGVIVLATIGPAPRGNTYEEKRAKKRFDNLNKLRDEDAKILASYAWVDKEKGVARIPIEHAMDLTIAQLAQSTPKPAGPLSTPTPQETPAATASPAASPGRAASPAASPTARPKSVQGVDSATHGQPAAAVKPAPAEPATQPGATTSPAAPAVPAGTPTPSSATTPSPTAPGSPLPVRGKTPP